MKRRIAVIAMAALAVTTVFSSADATQAVSSSANALPKAVQPVARLQSTLMSVMRAGKKLNYKARFGKLLPVVDGVFDFPFIARMVLGSDWKKIDKSQQEQFIGLLGRLSASSYAKQFDSYSAGEKFIFKGLRSVGSAQIAQYVFVVGNGKIVHFDYEMLENRGRWKIANVIVDGVSDLALKRGQYRQLFTKRGYPGLIAWIKKEVAENAH